MADRPWVTPDEVREYSEDSKIQNRSDAKLAVDITRAEALVIDYCNNDFSEYETIPDEVKTAVILLAERYSYLAVRITQGGFLTGESFDDYSYTSNGESVSIEEMGLEYLLKRYKKESTGNISADIWCL